MIQLVLSDEDRFDLFVLNEQLAIVLDVGCAEQTLQKGALSCSGRAYRGGSRLVSDLVQQNTKIQI